MLWPVFHRVLTDGPELTLVSRRPPGNALAALLLSVLDRLRDRVDDWLDRGSASSRWASVSRALTA